MYVTYERNTNGTEHYSNVHQRTKTSKNVHVHVINDQWHVKCINPPFLECNDNQGDKDIDEEEREDYEENDVENWNFNSIVFQRSHVGLSGLDRIPQHIGPALAGGYNKQCQESVENIVVVKIFALPLALLDLGKGVHVYNMTSVIWLSSKTATIRLISYKRQI